jgi:hypothetical protein
MFLKNVGKNHTLNITFLNMWKDVLFPFEEDMNMFKFFSIQASRKSGQREMDPLQHFFDVIRPSQDHVLCLESFSKNT